MQLLPRARVRVPDDEDLGERLTRFEAPSVAPARQERLDRSHVPNQIVAALWIDRRGCTGQPRRNRTETKKLSPAAGRILRPGGMAVSVPSLSSRTNLSRFVSPASSRSSAPVYSRSSSE